VDVDAFVRARRRQQALDALEFEGDRQAALLEQINEVLTELEGSRIDEAAFALMTSADVTLVREVLDPDGDEPDEEFDLEAALASESSEEIRREREEERIRLEDVINVSRSREQALERYLEALDGKVAAPGEGHGQPVG
jgi:hypothetical protein